MMGSVHRAAALLLVCSVGAAWAAEGFNPYEVPQEQVQRMVRTIALRPLVLPVGTESGDAARQRFEALITEKLRTKGYRVVPSSEYDRIWRQWSATLGGLYDPVSGKADDKEVDAVREHTARELARQHGADAILHLDIWVGIREPGIKMGLPKGYYHLWNEPLTWQGEPIADIPLNRPQEVLAAHLQAGLYDLSGVKMYGIWGGIEWTAVFMARGYEQKPASQLYQNEPRNRKAVDLILDDLVPVAGDH